MTGQGGQVQLLGPVRLVRDGCTVGVGTRKQRFVLAVLALNPNHLVTADRLIDLLWPDRPPATARGVIHGHISGLRAVLATSGLDNGFSLRREGPGYLLACDPMTVDAHHFTQLLNRAKTEPEPDHRLEILDEALALWRGPALADTASEHTRITLIRHLHEARLMATEDRLATLLDLDRHDEAVPELTRLAGEHPDRYRVTGLLMTALHRTGRTADALTLYRQTKHRLVDEQGLDPPPHLQQLELAILRDQPAPTDRVTRSTPAPAHLPTDVSAFTGRADAIERLDALLNNAGQPKTVVISALSGTAGVGKTALAIHWAHRVIDHFPDGQLYINLRAFDAGGEVVNPANALRGFLDALDVPPQRIPSDLNAQVGLYRSLLAGRRMLIILDNARDTAQVSPLLPGAPGCLVIVTSRNQLTSLIAAHGAHPITLDLLSVDEAQEHLSRRLGAERTAADPDAVHEIINRCARLPLALSLVAAHAALHPQTPLRTLVQQLDDTHQRWLTLTGDDPNTDMRAVFSWSYNSLTPDAARLFRFLGLHPRPDITTPAAASLAALTTTQTGQLLIELSRANLIREHSTGRYSLHDLLHRYATNLTEAIDPDDQRRKATTRLLDYYTHTAYEAAVLLDRAIPIPIPLSAPAAAVSPDHLPDSAQALNWMANEHRVLISLLRHATQTGHDTHAWQLAWALRLFLSRQRRITDLATTGELAATAARRLGNPIAQAFAERIRARAHSLLDRPAEAEYSLNQALTLYTLAGDPVGQGFTHCDLALNWESQRRYDKSCTHVQRALVLFTAAGDLAGQATALNGIGWSHTMLGNHAEALAYCERALTLSQQLRHIDGQACALGSLGHAHHHLGQHPQAIECYQRAITLYQQEGNPVAQGRDLIRLGDTYHDAGDCQAARHTYEQALTILNALDHPDARVVHDKLAAVPDS